MDTVYGLLWLAWIIIFLVIELSALWTGHPSRTLSDWVWQLEGLGRGWTFARYFIAAFLCWLAGHLIFGWWR
jgi:hypothetical protein